MIREIIQAIENGEVIEDHRGKLYRQEFGEDFLNKLKANLYSESAYILKNENKYIAIDRGSGGYPYDTDIRSCHRFPSKEDAIEYRKIFKANWSLHKLTIEMSTSCQK